MSGRKPRSSSSAAHWTSKPLAPSQRPKGDYEDKEKDALVCELSDGYGLEVVVWYPVWGVMASWRTYQVDDGNPLLPRLVEYGTVKKECGLDSELRKHLREVAVTEAKKAAEDAWINENLSS